MAFGAAVKYAVSEKTYLKALRIACARRTSDLSANVSNFETFAGGCIIYDHHLDLVRSIYDLQAEYIQSRYRYIYVCMRPHGEEAL